MYTIVLPLWTRDSRFQTLEQSEQEKSKPWERQYAQLSFPSSLSLTTVLTPCNTPPDSIDMPCPHSLLALLMTNHGNGFHFYLCNSHSLGFPSACWKVLRTLLKREFGLLGVNFHFSPQHPAKHLNHKSVSTWILPSRGLIHSVSWELCPLPV